MVETVTRLWAEYGRTEASRRQDGGRMKAAEAAEAAGVDGVDGADGADLEVD